MQTWQKYKDAAKDDPFIITLATVCVVLGLLDTFGLLTWISTLLPENFPKMNVQGLFLALAGSIVFSLRLVIQRTQSIAQYRVTEGDYISFRKSGFDISQLFLDAKEIMIVGVSCSSLLDEYEDELKQRISKGRSTKFLLVDENSPALTMACMRDNFSEDQQNTVENYQKMRIQAAIEKIRTWATLKQSPQIRQASYLPSHEFIFADFGNNRSTLIMRQYLFKTRIGGEITLEITSDGHTENAETYIHHLENLWKAASEAS